MNKYWWRCLGNVLNIETDRSVQTNARQLLQNLAALKEEQSVLSRMFAILHASFECLSEWCNHSVISCPKGNNHSPESNMPKRSKMVFSAIKAGYSKVNSPLWPNFEHMWDFMLAPDICKFHKDLIKNERTMLWTMSSMAFFNNQGQITPKWLVWRGQNLN